MKLLSILFTSSIIRVFNIMLVYMYIQLEELQATPILLIIHKYMLTKAKQTIGSIAYSYYMNLICEVLVLWIFPVENILLT